MRYEEMSVGKKVCYSIVAWLLLLITLGAVWYVNFVTPFNHEADLALKVFQYEFVADIVHTVMFLLTALLIVGISETMTRLKRHESERVMSMVFVIGLLLSLDISFKNSGYRFITVIITPIVRTSIFLHIDSYEVIIIV